MGPLGVDEQVRSQEPEPTRYGEADAEAVIEAAVVAYGHLDILVANHARSGSGSIGTLTAEEIDAHLAVKVRATMLLVQAFALRR